MGISLVRPSCNHHCKHCSFNFQQSGALLISVHDMRSVAESPSIVARYSSLFVLLLFAESGETKIRFSPHFPPVEPTGPELVNPCYAGSHDCDTTAQCIPLDGQAFQCQCATGYRGDGHNCYGVFVWISAACVLYGPACTCAL